MRQVLLLDDDPSQLAVRQLLLRRLAGIESQTVTEGRRALDFLRTETGKRTIGAVVTDHVMPDMDGPEFVRQVRSFEPEIPVIVVTGMPDADSAYNGLNVRFLMKPAEPEDLIAAVKKALDGDAHRRAS